MYAVTVLFRIKPDVMAEFMPLMQANARTSLSQEPGCQQFDICTDTERAAEVFLYELYTNRAAFDAHLQSAHFKAFDAAVSEMIADKTIHTFDQVQQ